MTESVREYSRLSTSVGEGGVAQLTLTAAEEFNRMPAAFWVEFPEALDTLNESGAIRAVVVSALGKHFSSGLDTTMFGGLGETNLDAGRRGEASIRNIGSMQDAFSVIERVRMPVIAAIQGACIGGGVDLASACDIRYCTADAFFCIQEINIGMAADVGTLQRLPNLIPDGLMRELAYTGRRMYADEAKEIGLVNDVFEDRDSMLKSVTAIADEIATKSPLAVASTKHLLNYGRDQSISDTLDYQQVWMSGVPQGGEIAKYFTAKSEGGTAMFDDLGQIREGGQ